MALIVNFNGLEEDKKKSEVIIKKLGFDLETLMKSLDEIEYNVFDLLLKSKYALNRKEVQDRIKEKSWHKVDRVLKRMQKQRLILSRRSDKKQKVVWFINPLIYKKWKDKEI